MLVSSVITDLVKTENGKSYLTVKDRAASSAIDMLELLGWNNVEGHFLPKSTKLLAHFAELHSKIDLCRLKRRVDPKRTLLDIMMIQAKHERGNINDSSWNYLLYESMMMSIITKRWTSSKGSSTWGKRVIWTSLISFIFIFLQIAWQPTWFLRHEEVES